MWSYKDGAISSVQVSVNLIGASSWLFCPKLIIALVESYLHRLSNSRNFYTMTSSATTWKVSFVSAPLDVPACQTCWSKRSYGNGDLNSYINFNMNTSKNGALCPICHTDILSGILFCNSKVLENYWWGKKRQLQSVVLCKQTQQESGDNLVIFILNHLTTWSKSHVTLWKEAPHFIWQWG